MFIFLRILMTSQLRYGLMFCDTNVWFDHSTTKWFNCNSAVGFIFATNENLMI